MFYAGGGRPKGSLSLKTLQIQAFCKSIVEDPEYRAAILQRARTNQLGSMEPVIWAYGYGRPKETIDLHVGRLEEDLSSLSVQDLALRAADLLSQLREAEEVERQILPYIDVTPLREAEVVDAKNVAEIREAAILAEAARRAQTSVDAKNSAESHDHS